MKKQLKQLIEEAESRLIAINQSIRDASYRIVEEQYVGKLGECEYWRDKLTELYNSLPEEKESK